MLHLKPGFLAADDLNRSAQLQTVTPQFGCSNLEAKSEPSYGILSSNELSWLGVGMGMFTKSNSIYTPFQMKLLVVSYFLN